MRRNTGAGATQRRFRTVANPVVSRLWEIDTVGYEHIPDHGPAILCPNHISFLDSAFLMLTLSRNVTFLGKAEYLDSWKTKFLFPAMGMIPIERSNGAQASVALDAAADVLRRGELFGIFPEGTRSRTGDLHKGRTGAARLALQLDCPVYPVGITGTNRIQPLDARFPKLRAACTIEIGPPIRPERYRDRGSAQPACRSMTDEIMFEIRQITGQRYVHEYARAATATPVSTQGQKSVAASGGQRAPAGITAAASVDDAALDPADGDGVGDAPASAGTRPRRSLSGSSRPRSKPLVPER